MAMRQIFDGNDVQHVDLARHVVLVENHDDMLAHGDEVRVGHPNPPSIREPQLERLKPVA